MTAPEWARLRLHCRGVVQGVGFRPLVHRLASRRGIGGSIVNADGAVLLDLHGTRGALQSLVEDLPAAVAAPAHLEPLQPQWLPPLAQPPQQLRIGSTPAELLGPGLVAPGLSADLAPCPACLAELRDPANRRHRYPFIGCAACGPRFSLASAIPFARAHTTLAAFPLCPACQAEFEDPADRRFHAETIGCRSCGPRLQLLRAGEQGAPLESTPLDPIEAAAALVRQGATVALQGVGGFQLLVDARNPGAVARLRQRKQRPAKPFALLVAELDGIASLVEISPEEERQLRSPAAPIVLLRRRRGQEQALEGVAPGSPCLGVMLPASPLHLLLAEAVGGPLVATSGNRSGELLCIDAGEAQQRLAGVVDAWLLHNRAIARPLDDSLLQVVEGRPRLLRRARGYVPTALELPQAPEARRTLLALGGDLKAAPALLQGGRLWLAPHLGDLAGARQLAWLEGGVEALLAGPQPAPEAVVADPHPDYLSHALARRLGLPCLTVQHHRAHGLAVAAEHGLALPLLAWCCDGLGLAPAPAAGHRLWGGELLLLETPGARWLAGVRPFPLPGAEAAMREGWRVALGLLSALGAEALENPAVNPCRAAAGAGDWTLLAQAVAAGLQAPLCSSMGRLFDAAAALLDLCQRQTYEGEAGLRLEGLARTAPAEVPGVEALVARAVDPVRGWLDWHPLLLQLLADRAAGRPVALSALWWHRALAEAMATLAARAAAAHGLARVALAGGCFQNALLLECTATALRRRGLEPYWAQQSPCNDGGLAVGQLWAALSDLPITKGSSR